MMRSKNNGATFRESSSKGQQRKGGKKWPRRHMSRRTLQKAMLEQLGHDNIQCVLDFVGHASSDVLYDMDYLQKIRVLLEACLDDEDFAGAFPKLSIESFRTCNGKPLPSEDHGKTEYFRQRTLPYYATKLYDMLSSTDFTEWLSTARAGEVIFYNELCAVASEVAHLEDDEAEIDIPIGANA